jgi:MFS family permease
VFIYAMLVPISPFFLTARLGVHENDVSFWSTVLLAAYAGVLLLAAPVCGILSDRLRARLVPIRLALLVLAAGMIMMATTRSLAVLVVGRVAQGFAASIIWVVGPALLVDASSGHEAGRDMGYVSMACGIGLLSPLLSGPIYQRAGYLSVFAMAFVLIGCSLVVCLCLVDPAATSCPADARSSRPCSTPDVERNRSPATEEKEPLRWRSSSVLALLLANAIANADYADCEIIVPVYTLRMFGWNSSETGLMMLALYGPIILLGPFVGEWA